MTAQKRRASINRAFDRAAKIRAEHAKAMTTDEQAVDRAKALLAQAIGCAVESETEMDLSDKDQVFVDDAIAAVLAALSQQPVGVEEIQAMIERLRRLGLVPGEGPSSAVRIVCTDTIALLERITRGRSCSGATRI